MLAIRFKNMNYLTNVLFYMSNSLLITLVLISPLQADIFVRDDIVTEPDIKHFSMCHAQGCKEVEQLSLNDTQWKKISQHFQPTATSAKMEREQIADAIAEFERIVGNKTNTSKDKAGLFASLGQAGQLDCIDESTNTTTYLLILQKQGLLKWHETLNHVTRGYFIFGWPHSSAAIKEIQTSLDGSQKKFAVDSWFEDNGMRPHIIPLSLWRSGWKP